MAKGARHINIDTFSRRSVIGTLTRLHSVFALEIPHHALFCLGLFSRCRRSRLCLHTLELDSARTGLSVQGVVADPTGAIVPGAEVDLVDPVRRGRWQRSLRRTTAASS